MKKILCTLLIAYLSASCGRDHRAAKIMPPVIMPLAVGNSWTFLDSSFDTGGFFTALDSSTLTITGTKTISLNDTSYDIFLWTWSKGYNGSSFYVQNDTNGLIFFGGVSPKKEYILPKALEVKYPVDVDEQWNVNTIAYYKVDSSFLRVFDSQITCISRDSLVESGAGSFECFVYRYQTAFGRAYPDGSDGAFSAEPKGPLNKGAAAIEVIEYYDPGIGYVGFTQKANAIVTFRKILKSYSLNP